MFKLNEKEKIQKGITEIVRESLIIEKYLIQEQNWINLLKQDKLLKILYFLLLCQIIV